VGVGLTLGVSVGLAVGVGVSPGGSQPMDNTSDTAMVLLEFNRR